jgi:hypothetical protein
MAKEPKLVHVSEFVSQYTPPEYRIDGIIQRSRLYSLTAPTSHGKTAIALSTAVHEGLGKPLAGRRVDDDASIVYFAAENPDEVRGRLILMAAKMGLDLDRLPLYLVAGSFNIHDWTDAISKQVLAIGGATTAYIDTSPAFQVACGFTDENDNVQALNFASTLRSFTSLPGNPAVLALTHPTKNANTRDNLIPRGGGAFLNEVDGNLTAWADGDRTTTELHWLGKLRGPGFDPITFALEQSTCPGLVDKNGRQMPSVWAYPTSHERADAAESKSRDEEDSLLIAMFEAPDHSLLKWAELLVWRQGNGEPAKWLVYRTMERLHTEKLVKKSRGRWVLTSNGQTEAKRLKGQAA